MFSTPSVLTLDNQPIGRGMVQLLNGENGNGLGSRCGEYFNAQLLKRVIEVSVAYNRYIG